MARRKKAARRRRSTGFRVISAIESYAYTSVITQGLFDASPIQFLTAGDNVTAEANALTPEATQEYFMNNPSLGAVYGANPLSLRDIVGNPGFAANAIIGRGMANGINMALQAATINVGFRLFKSMLRRPLSNIQRNLIKPAFGATVRLS
tara:strand:+ start:366 stop:815 length:450 start_codon:yes stop_codon:yes gene_type:complete